MNDSDIVHVSMKTSNIIPLSIGPMAQLWP